MRFPPVAFYCFAAAGALFGQGRGIPAQPAPMAMPAQPGLVGSPQTVRAAPLTGTGSVEGQVVNAATGAPLKKVNVRLFGIGDQSNPNPTRTNKETDDMGHFVFTNLPPGRYSLSGERQGFLSGSYGARKLSGNGTPVPLGQDQHLKDLAIKLNPQSVIVGKVVDEDGDPVANVNVQALRYLYRQGKKQWVPNGNGQTSDIGEFRIPELQPGRYLVSANGRNAGMNFMPLAATEPLPDKPEMIYATTYYPNSTDSATAAPVDVGAAAEIRGIEIHLQKTKVFRVRGRVTNAPGGGGGRGGAPVMVSLVPKDSPVGGGQGRHNGNARPPDGIFEIRGVPPGSYIIYAQTNGQGQLIATQPVDVTSGHVDGLNLTMGPGNDIQGTVKVVDATAPIDLSNVSIMLRPAPGVQVMGGGIPRSKLGEGNRFTLKNVAPVRFGVTVQGVPENCYVQSLTFGGQPIGLNDTVEMSGSGPIEVTVSAAAGSLDVAMVDKDGRPAQGATLFIVNKDGTPAFTRGGNGNDTGAQSYKGLAPGEYRVFAWEDVEPGAYQDPDFRRPFESKSETVKVEAGAAAKVQVKVIPVEDMGVR
jgi:hypothetical protein